jgi:polyhydroxyalkanoate synthesis regulator phasin
MSIKDKVLEEGMKLASHPAIAPILQDERFMKLFMAALAMPGRIEQLTDEQRANLVRVLGVATKDEVADLRRAVRSLEDEVARLRAELAAKG